MPVRSKKPMMITFYVKEKDRPLFLKFLKAIEKDDRFPKRKGVVLLGPALFFLVAKYVAFRDELESQPSSEETIEEVEGEEDGEE